MQAPHSLPQHWSERVALPSCFSPVFNQATNHFICRVPKQSLEVPWHQRRLLVSILTLSAKIAAADATQGNLFIPKN